MTARTHHNRIPASQAKLRSGSRTKAKTASLPGGSKPSSRSRQRKSARSGKGARPIWMMVIVGGLIGSIFILAQRFQMHTLHLKRMEEGLKSEIDTLASQQPYLNFQRDKAMSTQESQKVASEYNLNQPGLGRTVVRRAETETKTIEETEGNARPALSKVAKAANRQPVLTKQPVKGMKNTKVVLAIKTAKPTVAGKSAQADQLKKENKPANKQASKSQPLRKAARH
ncbi:MAG: hypothetical protein JST85_24485 [Acidobacteria bacterium]|nr:hypothetical protein [Acidobacteriota bacterium]